MISLATVRLIEQLFRDGRDVLAIAKAASCSKSTVYTVLAGKHTLQIFQKRPAPTPGASYTTSVG